jgi:membrane-bound metal-dependent hydrolase YbcI (DUF457 family)
MAVGFAAGVVVLPRVAEAHGVSWPAATVVAVSLVPMAAARLPDMDLRLRWLGVKHRGVTHSLLFVVACWLATRVAVTQLDVTWGWWLPAAVATGVGVGGVGPDCLTVRGCPLLWPLSRARFRVAWMTTGEWVERVFRWVVVAVAAALLVGAPTG